VVDRKYPVTFQSNKFRIEVVNLWIGRGFGYVVV